VKGDACIRSSNFNCDRTQEVAGIGHIHAEAPLPLEQYAGGVCDCGQNVTVIFPCDKEITIDQFTLGI